MTHFILKYTRMAEWPKGDLLSADDRVAIAYAMYDAGFTPCWSHDVCDSLIAGYGDCMMGFRYELVVDDERGTADARIVPWAEVKERMARGWRQ